MVWLGPRWSSLAQAQHVWKQMYARSLVWWLHEYQWSSMKQLVCRWDARFYHWRFLVALPHIFVETRFQIQSIDLLRCLYLTKDWGHELRTVKHHGPEGPFILSCNSTNVSRWPSLGTIWKWHGITCLPISKAGELLLNCCWEWLLDCWHMKSKGLPVASMTWSSASTRLVMLKAATRSGCEQCWTMLNGVEEQCCIIITTPLVTLSYPLRGWWLYYILSSRFVLCIGVCDGFLKAFACQGLWLRARGWWQSSSGCCGANEEARRKDWCGSFGSTSGECGGMTTSTCRHWSIVLSFLASTQDWCSVLLECGRQLLPTGLAASVSLVLLNEIEALISLVSGDEHWLRLSHGPNQRSNKGAIYQGRTCYIDIWLPTSGQTTPKKSKAFGRIQIWKAFDWVYSGPLSGKVWLSVLGNHDYGVGLKMFQQTDI